MSEPRRKLPRFAAASLLALLLFPAPAHAVRFFFEAGGGLSQLRGMEPAYGVGIPSTSDLGFTVSASAFASFSDGRNPIELQIGFEPRLSSAPAGGTNYSLLAAYPIVRVQLSTLFFGAGATPLAYTRSSGTAGIDSFTLINGGLAYFGEVGVLWPVTPEFSMGVSGAASFLNGPSGLSPAPVYDGTFFMRFYVGAIGENGPSSGRTSNEFKGWRYPFGHMSN